MKTDPKRMPSGSPTGGQFAPDPTVPVAIQPAPPRSTTPPPATTDAVSILAALTAPGFDLPTTRAQQETLDELTNPFTWDVVIDARMNRDGHVVALQHDPAPITPRDGDVIAMLEVHETSSDAYGSPRPISEAGMCDVVTDWDAYADRVALQYPGAKLLPIYRDGEDLTCTPDPDRHQVGVAVLTWQQVQARYGSLSAEAWLRAGADVHREVHDLGVYQSGRMLRGLVIDQSGAIIETCPGFTTAEDAYAHFNADHAHAA